MFIKNCVRLYYTSLLITWYFCCNVRRWMLVVYILKRLTDVGWTASARSPMDKLCTLRKLTSSGNLILPDFGSEFLSKLHGTYISLYLFVPGSVTCCLDTLQLAYLSAADNAAYVLWKVTTKTSYCRSCGCSWPCRMPWWWTLCSAVGWSTRVNNSFIWKRSWSHWWSSVHRWTLWCLTPQICSVPPAPPSTHLYLQVFKMSAIIFRLFLNQAS